MTNSEKIFYGILNDTIYAATGPALLRAIASHVVLSGSSFSMGQLRRWFGETMAENLVRKAEAAEEAAVPGPITDDTVLTNHDIAEDLLEDYGWIENAMSEELTRSVNALGAPVTYRGGLGLKSEQLPEFERLLHEEGIELTRDDDLVGLLEDYGLTADQVDEVAARLQ